jgi:hypothetical protein
VRDRGPGELVALGEQIPTALVLSPDISDEHPVPPFYHPAVRHLAIRYVLKDAPGKDGTIGSVVVDVIRLSGDVALHFEPREGHPSDANGASHESDDNAFPSRIVKTCVSLLEGVCRVGYGYANGYRKRVDHDVRLCAHVQCSILIVLADACRQGRVPGPLPENERNAWRAG